MICEWWNILQSIALGSEYLEHVMTLKGIADSGVREVDMLSASLYSTYLYRDSLLRTCADSALAAPAIKSAPHIVCPEGVTKRPAVDVEAPVLKLSFSRKANQASPPAPLESPSSGDGPAVGSSCTAAEMACMSSSPRESSPPKLVLKLTSSTALSNTDVGHAEAFAHVEDLNRLSTHDLPEYIKDEVIQSPKLKLVLKRKFNSASATEEIYDGKDVHQLQLHRLQHQPPVVVPSPSCPSCPSCPSLPLSRTRGKRLSKSFLREVMDVDVDGEDTFEGGGGGGGTANGGKTMVSDDDGFASSGQESGSGSGSGGEASVGWGERREAHRSVVRRTDRSHSSHGERRGEVKSEVIAPQRHQRGKETKDQSLKQRLAKKYGRIL